MPLDRSNGEVLGGFEGSRHIVIDPHRLAEMTNLLVEYQAKKKFGTVTRQRPLFDDAVAHAIEAFANKGALRPIRFDEDDVLVQVYPHERKVVVVFQRKIAGEEFFVSRIYDLPQIVIDQLLAGKRPRLH